MVENRSFEVTECISIKILMFKDVVMYFWYLDNLLQISKFLCSHLAFIQPCYMGNITSLCIFRSYDNGLLLILFSFYISYILVLICLGPMFRCLLAVICVQHIVMDFFVSIFLMILSVCHYYFYTKFLWNIYCGMFYKSKNIISLYFFLQRNQFLLTRDCIYDI